MIMLWSTDAFLYLEMVMDPLRALDNHHEGFSCKNHDNMPDIDISCAHGMGLPQDGLPCFGVGEASHKSNRQFRTYRD